MSCEVCLDTSASLICKGCCLAELNCLVCNSEKVNGWIVELKQKFEEELKATEVYQKISRLASLRQMLEKKRNELSQTQALIDSVKATLETAKKVLYRELPSTDLPEIPNKPVNEELEKLRTARLIEAAEILGTNSFFPDYSIGELFTVSSTDSCWRMGENSSTFGQTSTLDAITPIIVRMRTDLSMASEQHCNSVMGSLEMLCSFISYASHLCQVELPFEITRRDKLPFNMSRFSKFFAIRDLQGGLQKLNVLDLFGFESSMLLLYLNFRVLLLARRVSTKSSSLFDVNALINRPAASAKEREPLPEDFELTSSFIEPEEEDDASSEDSWEVL